jgi:hypothetical protein
MKPKPGIAVLLLVGAIPLAALAVAPAAPWSGGSPARADSSASSKTPAMFRQLDTNDDGFIAKAEAAPSDDLTARFGKLDADRDGRISVQEYIQGIQRLA